MSESHPAFSALLASLQSQLAILPDKPDETPEATLKALWLLAAGQPMAVQYVEPVPLPLLDEKQFTNLQAFIAQRLSGIPLAHLTGRQGFMGLSLCASAAALIPRPETEIVAKLALQTLNDQNLVAPLVVDVCTGSGNIALAVAHHYPGARVFAADLSAAAVALAQTNAAQLQLEHSVEFRCGDLLEPFRQDAFLGQVDVLICNPPYILANNVKKMPKEIAEFEPELAFDGGPLGIAIIERTIREAVEFLKPGAWLCLEIGAGQGAFVEKRILKSGLYQAVETACDAQGIIRALRCRRHL